MAVDKPKKKVVGRPIQKGQVLNPRGAAAHNPQLRAIRAMSRADIAAIGTMILEKTVEELMAIREAKQLPMLQDVLLSVLIDAKKHGNMEKLDKLLDRIAGPVPTKSELTGADGAPLIPQARTSEERAADLAKLQALRDKLGKP